VIGLGRPDAQTTLIAAWYFGLAAIVLASAYRDPGRRRAAGIVVIAACLPFRRVPARIGLHAPATAA